MQNVCRDSSAATLRRALESAASGEDRRLRELIREIQQLALACRTSPPPDDYFCDVSGPPQVFASFSRTLWQPDVTGHAAQTLAFDSGAFDRQVLERFRALADLNLARLRKQVQTCLVTDDSILLSQILQRFPPREGILEVVGYVLIGMQESQHYVAEDQLVDIQIGATGDNEEVWRIPEVLFTRNQ